MDQALNDGGHHRGDWGGEALADGRENHADPQGLIGQCNAKSQPTWNNINQVQYFIYYGFKK